MCFLGGGELGWFCLFVWEEIEDERKLVDYAKKIIKSSHVVLSSCLASKEQEKY